MRRYGACLLPVEAWRSLVARLLREQEVVGSSPVASTNVETRLFCKESAFYRSSHREIQVKAQGSELGVA